jgi:hypothetical protein
MAGQPERDPQIRKWQKEWQDKNVRSSMSKLAKRSYHIEWNNEDEEEYW